MSRPLNADTLAASLAATGYGVVILAALDFSSGVVRATSAPFDIVWNGETYLGVGNLGAISAVEESVEMQAYSIQLALTGIPSETRSIALSEHYQGRDARIWRAWIDRDHAIVGDPVEIFRGRMDFMDMQLGPVMTIAITCHDRRADWDRPRIRRYTNEDQQAEYSGDKFFEYMPQMAERPITWGRG